MSRRDDLNLLRGTLDLMVLKALEAGPLHGYGVVRWVRNRTDDELSIEDGALYTALHRMETKGWLNPSWGMAETQRRAKFYALTRKGRAELAKREEQWQRYAAALGKVVSG